MGWFATSGFVPGLGGGVPNGGTPFGQIEAIALSALTASYCPVGLLVVAKGAPSSPIENFDPSCVMVKAPTKTPPENTRTFVEL